MEIQFSELETQILTSFTQQYLELLSIPESTAQDPFIAWARQFQEPDLDTSDPVIQRLFPDTYLADASANAEFRRLTMDDARRVRIADANQVLADLAKQRFDTTAASLPAWLKTLSGLRLSLAVRLNIVDEELPADFSDEQLAVYEMYSWLGMLLEVIVQSQFPADFLDESQLPED